MYVTGTQTRARKARQQPIGQNKVIHMVHTRASTHKVLASGKAPIAAMFFHLGTMGVLAKISACKITSLYL